MTNNSKNRGEISASLIVAMIAIAIILGGVWYFTIKKEQPTSGNGAAMENESGDVIPASSSDEMMMKKEGGMMEDSGKYSGAILAGKSALLLDFKKTDYDSAVKTDKLVVLYFYANWCPICKEETVNALYPAFNEIATDKVIGFRVNYNDNQTDDDEVGLAREFGVAYQHTKLFVKNGQRILKSPEEWDKSRYLSEINKAI